MFLEISGIRKNYGEKLLKLSESRGIAKKNCCGNFKELFKNFKENCGNFKERWKIWSDFEHIYISKVRSMKG